MIYLIDSSCLMTASQTTYPFDVAISFWNKISSLAKQHRFYSIDKVQKEINENIDELSKWCKNTLPQDFFIMTDTNKVYIKYGELVNWASKKVKNKEIKQTAFDKFTANDKADIFLISFALSNPLYTIVTEEISAPYSKKDIKLPDACSAF